MENITDAGYCVFVTLKLKESRLQLMKVVLQRGPGTGFVWPGLAGGINNTTAATLADCRKQTPSSRW